MTNQSDKMSPKELLIDRIRKQCDEFLNSINPLINEYVDLSFNEPSLMQSHEELRRVRTVVSERKTLASSLDLTGNVLNIYRCLRHGNPNENIIQLANGEGVEITVKNKNLKYKSDSLYPRETTNSVECIYKGTIYTLEGVLYQNTVGDSNELYQRMTLSLIINGLKVFSFDLEPERKVDEWNIDVAKPIKDPILIYIPTQWESGIIELSRLIPFKNIALDTVVVNQRNEGKINDMKSRFGIN